MTPGCGSSAETDRIVPVEERFEKAKALFDNEDYLEAINEFTVITLQNQGSAYADDAQYYIAEARFKRGEFLLAAYEYGTLVRNMRASPLVPDAQYKLGLSYYMLSPDFTLDQKYTRQAIEELQTFVEYYPSNEHAADAAEKIGELTTKLAKKEYQAAQLYMTLEYYKSAIVYFDDVIEKYHDTEFAPLSYLGKTEALLARKKYDEAKVQIDKFFERFPNSVLRARAEKLNEKIQDELKSKPAASSKETGSIPGDDGGKGLSFAVKVPQ